ncbi:glycosyltransferase [Synechococcus sp. 1G10]|uniref:glycosyltransferase n=1 Tax=Synechococcus sp. 1G10 TaxID=2025605 RepID=UPI0013039BED|nr:glycosyltransferase [Synechococcus sp. 1G10]
MQMPQPEISIIMITYNHGPYIGKAIESVIAQSVFQQTELLIGDDCSQDETFKIASSFAAQYPDNIHLFRSSPEPLGPHRNFERLCRAMRAPFVAFLEGDDWWIDPHKLETQLALLKAHNACSFCGAYTEVVDERDLSMRSKSSLKLIKPSQEGDELDFSALIRGFHFHISSVLMRSTALMMPDWIYSQYCLDRPLYLLAAQHGNAVVLHRVVSVYRQHGTGVWASRSAWERAQRSWSLFHTFMQVFPARYCILFRRTLSEILWSYLPEVLYQKEPVPRAQARKIIHLSVVESPYQRLLLKPRLTLAALYYAYLRLPHGSAS